MDEVVVGREARAGCFGRESWLLVRVEVGSDRFWIVVAWMGMGKGAVLGGSAVGGWRRVGE